MEDAADKENPPPADFNKIDLSQLQGFSFGTQWTQDKSSPASGRDGGDRPRRDDRRDAFPGGPPNRRDRRAFQKPNGELPPADDRPAPAGRREYSDDRGPRRPAGGPGDDSFNRRRGAPRDAGPYLSPYFSVIFYPEDGSFTALAKTIRASCRTIELFEIARTVLAKPERFTVLVARKAPGSDGSPARAEGEPAAPGVKPAPFFLSVPDGVPFETEEAAVAHVLNRHLELFFTRAEVEVDPPKGNFQVVNRCTITGELLAPPNYHRYAEIVQQHHAEKVSRMSLEAYRSRIESVRDPEVIQQWLEKMKKVLRYTWKEASAAAAPSAPVAAPAAPTAAVSGEASASAAIPAAAATGDGSAPAATEPVPAPGPEAPAAAPAETPAPAEAPAAATAPSFDTLDEARSYLLTHARDRIIRTTGTARFHGRALEGLPAGEIRRAVEGEWERQCRFPLDTANALRGRLRREHFTIFKKGSKGVSYVCAVKRKFRVPGQAFAENIGTLITFIENHPMVKASGLVEKFLGLAPAAAGESGAEPTFTAEQRDKIARLQGDVRWLVHEGYVTEFIDGTLYAPPPVVEARKKEIEAEEQDPENFPERPPASAPPEAAQVSAPEPVPTENPPPPP
jgi:hypothetical protein